MSLMASNTCRYVLRRTKQDFRAHRGDTDASNFIGEAKDALELVKRQAVVYSMYARKHKSIMVRRSTCSPDALTTG